MSFVREAVHGVGLVVVLQVEAQPHPNLPNIRETDGGAPLLTRLLENREEERGKQENDADDDEQFDEGECGSGFHDVLLFRGRGRCFFLFARLSELEKDAGCDEQNAWDEQKQTCNRAFRRIGEITL